MLLDEGISLEMYRITITYRDTSALPPTALNLKKSPFKRTAVHKGRFSGSIFVWQGVDFL